MPAAIVDPISRTANLPSCGSSLTFSITIGLVGLMTTMAALLGAVPMAFGTGTGSEIRQPLGYAMVGGLIVSQALTLFTTPVIYLWFDRLALRFSGRSGDAGRASEVN